MRRGLPMWRMEWHVAVLGNLLVCCNRLAVIVKEDGGAFDGELYPRGLELVHLLTRKIEKFRNLLTARFIFGHFVPAIRSRNSLPKAGCPLPVPSDASLPDLPKSQFLH